MVSVGGFTIGILMGLLAGLLNGIFLLPMRYTKKWAWENSWLFFSILSCVIFPWIAASVAIPHLASVLRSVPLSAFVPGILAGLVWGVGQVMYGLGCGMVGIAVGSATISSTAIIAGILGPLIVYTPGQLLTPSSFVLLAATGLIIAGIYTYGKAGARRERETAATSAPQVVAGSFRVGLTVCLVCGVLGTAFVYGGKSSTALVEAAEAVGAQSFLAFYVAYAVTFSAGGLVGVIYCAYKLLKNKTGSNFWNGDVFLWNLAMAASMGLLWYCALLSYGMGSEKLGKLGASVAFALFSSGTVLFANLFGWLGGEWKGASRKTIQGFIKGMMFIIGAIFLIAFGLHTP